jgi:RND family efflux transporter MFP subunit
MQARRPFFSCSYAGNRYSGIAPRAAALLALAFTAACGEAEEAPKAERAAVPVFTTQIEERELVQPITGTGTIAAQKTTDMGPQVDGIIDEVYVRVGDRVKEGDALFKTRAIDFELQVKELESRVKLARAEMRNAEREFKRIKELRSKGVVSIGQLDKVQAAYDVASAQYGVADAQLEQARQRLKDATVRAPFDGVITQQDIYEGKFMATRGGGGGMGGPSGVVQIQKIDIVGAIVNVPAVHLSKLALGTPAKVYIDGVDEVYDSEIHILNDKVDHTTRSIEVRVGLKNEDYKIKTGLFTRAEFYPPPRKALVMDRSALLGIEGARYVFVPDQGRARRQPVEAVQLDAASVEILRGLEAGDKVLTGPMLGTLIDGLAIRIEESNSGSAAPETAAMLTPTQTGTR